MRNSDHPPVESDADVQITLYVEGSERQVLKQRREKDSPERARVGLSRKSRESESQGTSLKAFGQQKHNEADMLQLDKAGQLQYLLVIASRSVYSAISGVSKLRGRLVVVARMLCIAWTWCGISEDPVGNN